MPDSFGAVRLAFHTLVRQVVIRGGPRLDLRKTITALRPVREFPHVGFCLVLLLQPFVLFVPYM
jgi:hypothetical protein